MFALSRSGERLFYFLTFLTQGSSYLNPRAYAIMHRMHHAYSDTEKDPHSPVFFRNPVAMMHKTLLVYLDIFSRKMKVPQEFEGGYPEWPAFDRVANSLPMRLVFVAAYISFYLVFATAWWQYLLLPVNVFMGPIHGAIVNWCGHRYGYQNYDNKDESRNSLPVDMIAMGELMQNNHHRHAMQVNFAVKWFEFDPTHFLIRLLGLAGIVRPLPVRAAD